MFILFTTVACSTKTESHDQPHKSCDYSNISTQQTSDRKGKQNYSGDIIFYNKTNEKSENH